MLRKLANTCGLECSLVVRRRMVSSETQRPVWSPGRPWEDTGSQPGRQPWQPEADTQLVNVTQVTRSNLVFITLEATEKTERTWAAIRRHLFLQDQKYTYTTIILNLNRSRNNFRNVASDQIDANYASY